MRARLVALIAIVLAASSVSAPAWAAPPSPADLASAKKLFEQGLKLYNEGSYREALSDFLHANELSPRASIQRNIAQCHRDLREFAEAYDAYQVLLTKYGATMTAADKRAVQRAIDELASLTATVKVNVTDPGATVAVDGNTVGTTPLASPLRVNLGAHTVTVAKPGYETLTKDLKVNGGDTVSVDGPLQTEVTTGHLVVNAPANVKVEVFVDGKDMGPAPWEGDVQPGVHTVEARGGDSFSQPKPIDVARKARAEVMLDIVAHSGTVQVDTHTADATITIDDKQVGTGVWEGTLPEGEHQLVVQAPGYRDYKRAFIVHAGERFVEDTPLESESAAKYEGLYSGLALFGFATPSGASNDYASETSSPLGAGLAVRVGYQFGWIAIEGLVLGQYDHSAASFTQGTSGVASDALRNASYDFHRFGGGGAVGVRVASKHPHVRFTGSAMIGAVAMGNIYNLAATSQAPPEKTAKDTSSTTTYGSPLLLLDAGVLLGSAGGAKFHLSGLFMAQFVGGAVQAPAISSPGNPTQLGTNSAGASETYVAGPLNVAQGTQIFIGPMLGM
ncbi:MAG TPA: PEGA domain-containing protein, partial [Polyangiaceae bacterium]|nr:PEGA domain-containing protein [Polyangiaceae bacterium]